MKSNKNDRPSVTKNIYFLVIGLVIGTFSLFAASSFRDFADSVLQLSVPLSEKTVSGGSLLVAYRFFYFLIILSILVTISIVLVT